MSTQNNIAISVSGLHKSFKLPHEQHSGIKQGLISALRKNRKKGYEIQHVLKGLNFEVEKGDFFGIVGRNGSGKSTLLKLLAGIYTPDEGYVQVSGTLTPFIELGVGFNPELTGRENVYMNGALLGFSRKEMEEKYDDIVSFSELERFMDQKLKNYSSGMQVRLAFSIAIQAKSDLLILDEVLAVGDEAFQRKCSIFFEKIKKDKTRTVVLVTHDMSAVRRYCNKAILIHNGEITASGSPEKVADEYLVENIEHQNEKPNTKLENKSRPWIKATIIGNQVLKNTDTLQVQVKYKNTDTRSVYAKVIIQYSDANIMITNAKIHHDLITKDQKEHTMMFSISLKDFNWGDCRIVALLVDDVEGINLADFGYDSELIFKIPQSTKVAGIMTTTAELELVE